MSGDGAAALRSEIASAGGVASTAPDIKISSGSSDRITTRREAAHFLRQVTMSPTVEEITEALALGSRRAYLVKYIYMPESRRSFPAWDDTTSPPTPLGGWTWEVTRKLSAPIGTTTPVNFHFPGSTYVSRMALTTFLGDHPARQAYVNAAANAQGGTAATLFANDEAVRNKAAWILSKFIPVSVPGGAYDAYDKAIGMMAWYSIMHRYAFRNYADLLEEVTYSFPMSLMLTYTANKKETNGVRPDENYARELMQLFTIGLYEMNMDGTYKLDADGKRINTYSQADIMEMSKVFTGLCRWDSQDSSYLASNTSAAANMIATGLVTQYQSDYWRDMSQAGNQYTNSTYQTPKAGVPPRLRHYLPFYETGAKNALGGKVNIPANTEARANIRMAIDALVKHPNCAPFVAKHLIKSAVTSNPSPGYVSRVASVFENNGRGERGDLSAVWLAIWCDPEATNTIHTSDTHGRIRDGFEAYATAVRGMHRHSQLPVGTGGGSCFYDGVITVAPLVGPIQDYERSGDFADWPMMAPSIFGHHSPEYTRAPADKWGVTFPEMGSKSDTILMRTYNQMSSLNQNRDPGDPAVNSEYAPRCSDYATLFGSDYTTAGNAGAAGITETCNQLFCGGTLPAAKIDAIVAATENIVVSTDAARINRVNAILEFITKTTEFMVM